LRQQLQVERLDLALEGVAWTLTRMQELRHVAQSCVAFRQRLLQRKEFMLPVLLLLF
jgi:hypothetical protein